MYIKLVFNNLVCFFLIQSFLFNFLFLCWNKNIFCSTVNWLLSYLRNISEFNLLFTRVKMCVYFDLQAYLALFDLFRLSGWLFSHMRQRLESGKWSHGHLISYVCFHFGVVVFDSSFFVYFLMLLGHILFSKISSDVVFLRKLKQKNHFKQLLISQGFLSTWLWLSCEPIQAFDTGSNQDRFRTNSLFGLAPENSFHNASHYSSLLTKKYAINIYF